MSVGKEPKMFYSFFWKFLKEICRVGYWVLYRFAKFLARMSRFLVRLRCLFCVFDGQITGSLGFLLGLTTR